MVQAGGLCFAHGPWTEGLQCPRWPGCATDPQNPAYIVEGLRLVVSPETRTRLERAVIDAARNWNNANHRDTDAVEATLTHLGDAVDELEAFEQKQK